MRDTFYTLKTVKERVYLLLKDHKHLRDSDERLIASFWYYEVGGDRFSKMSAHDLLKQFSEGNLASAESIRRCRQKIQEQNEELRGQSYVRRKDEGIKMRTNIHNL